MEILALLAAFALGALGYLYILMKKAQNGRLLPPPPGVDTGTTAYRHANSLIEISEAEMRKFPVAVLKSIFKAALRNPMLRYSKYSTQEPNSDLPRLNQRARGWLKFLYTKASSDSVDDWSSVGTPSDMWDKDSIPPMCSFPRFDLHESAYAMVLMADLTPAWREPYTAICEQLASKYITHWGAVDFLNQFGDDPNRNKYPYVWKGLLVPSSNFREYNAPGWTGNGIGAYPDGTPEGICDDPIKAEGMLFFKGWLVLTMGIFTYISGDDRFFSEWSMANVADRSTTWTLDTVTDHLHKQWGERACGLH